jgi:hypothetical protein
MTLATTGGRRARMRTSRAVSGNPLKERPVWVAESTWQRIADTAYQLYQQRGRRDGYALEDRLEGEHIVKQESYETH